MPIHYAAVGYGSSIIAENALSSGSYGSVAASLLSQLDTTRPQRMVFSYDRSLVHYWVTEDLMVFMCMTGEDCSRRVAFQFLQQLHDAFYAEYPNFNPVAPPSQNLTSKFGPTIARLASNPPPDTLELAQSELSSVRQVMISNIERVLERGDRIEVLVDKTMSLQGHSEGFRRQSRQVRKTMEWKNVKLMLLAGSVLLVVAYLISGEVCGFPAWGRCIHYGTGGEANEESAYRITLDKMDQ